MINRKKEFFQILSFNFLVRGENSTLSRLVLIKTLGNKYNNKQMYPTLNEAFGIVKGVQFYSSS